MNIDKLISRLPYKRFLLNGALQAVGTVAGSAISSSAQKKINREMMEFEREEAATQRDWNEKMWNAQNDWNLAQWNRENEYNSPIEQVQRLRDAGLNPLFYGLDGSSASSMSSAQPLGYERASTPNLGNPGAPWSDAAMKIAQIANVQAQTEKTKSETKAIDSKLPFEVDSLRAQIRQSNLSSDAQETLNKYIDQQQEAELRVKDATAAQADAMVQKAAAEIEKMDYEKTTMYISWLETNERILNLQKQRELTDAEIAELASLVKKNNAEAEKIGLDVKNYDEITVLGTASTSMRFGPVSIQEGEPITLAAKKAAKAHLEQLKKEEEERKKNGKEKSMSDIKQEYPE